MTLDSMKTKLHLMGWAVYTNIPKPADTYMEVLRVGAWAFDACVWVSGWPVATWFNVSEEDAYRSVLRWVEAANRRADME